MPLETPRAGGAGRLLLVVASVVSTSLLLALIEVTLRVTGIGAPDAAQASRLKYQHIHLPLFEPSTRADGIVVRTVDTRLPPQSILRDKPRNGLRIFVFGESATAGLGFSPNVTFARDLERMLRQNSPGRSIEVVNLGIVALASQQIKLLVSEVCSRWEPDLVIVYCGNNEFLEVHAEKYAQAQATWLSKVSDRVRTLNLYRLSAHLLAVTSDAPAPSEKEFSEEDLHLTQDEIVRSVEMSPAEVDDIVARYETNLDGMVRVASARSTPIMLMTVASNWRWRGRHDLPEGWLTEILGSEISLDRTGYQRAVAVLTKGLTASPTSERHVWLFKRATVYEQLGEVEAARADYRAAMNEDPHLRRALDRMNDRVRGVGARRAVPLVDVVELLSSQTPDGIIGFEEFFDYVHFTPRGNLLVAAALFDAIQRIGLVETSSAFDAEQFVADRSALLRALTVDSLRVEEWMGFGFDVARIHDRNLWKYERLKEELDSRLARDPSDVRALVYRGNWHFFRAGEAAEAARDYRSALAVAAEEDRGAIRANLDRLTAESRR